MEKSLLFRAAPRSKICLNCSSILVILKHSTKLEGKESEISKAEGCKDRRKNGWTNKEAETWRQNQAENEFLIIKKE